jgi:hypothetical protein
MPSSRAVDVRNDPVPSPPSTHDAAMAMLKAGWWLNLMYRCHVFYQHRIVSGKHAVRAWMGEDCGYGAWEDYRDKEFYGPLLREGRLKTVRPESD